MAASGGWALGKTETLRFSVDSSIFCRFRRDSGESPAVAGTVGFVWMLAVQRWSEFGQRWSMEGESKGKVIKGRERGSRLERESSKIY